MKRLLVLGGTQEGTAISNAVAERFPDVHCTTSLAGITAGSCNICGEVRRGVFGGIDGLVQYIRNSGTGLLVDATHPFAAIMARHAETAAARTGTPRIKFVRPHWKRVEDDNWIEVDTYAEAAETLCSMKPTSVLLTTGNRSLEAFSKCQGMRLTARVIELPVSIESIGAIEILRARGPFRLEDEQALFRDLQVDALVTKASGGAATEAKIIAARTCGIPVIMIRRPQPPSGQKAHSIEEVLAWIGSHAGVRATV